MSKTWFPDLIGPSSVSANGGAAVGIRQKTLNLLSSGVTAADNPSARRLDITIPDPAWMVVGASTILSGEWLPSDPDLGRADFVRVDTDTPGTVLTGLDSGADPTRLVKYIGNIGAVTITLQPPASPVAGKQYFSGAAYALTANSTVRVVWDSISRVYRVRGNAAAPTSLIALNGQPLALSGNHITNPT